jgi:hypothetical protein
MMQIQHITEITSPASVKPSPPLVYQLTNAKKYKAPLYALTLTIWALTATLIVILCLAPSTSVECLSAISTLFKVFEGYNTLSETLPTMMELASSSVYAWKLLNSRLVLSNLSSFFYTLSMATTLSLSRGYMSYGHLSNFLKVPLHS